jgi:hypothetical protein
MPRKPAAGLIHEDLLTRLQSDTFISALAFPFETVVALLLPIRRQYRLNILWPLGDRLIPGQAILSRKARHGLDELLHLIVQQVLAIAGLNGFHLTGRTPIPALNRDLIRCAMDR